MYKIMIVEDDKTIGTLLCQHLSQWGYDAFLARDLTDVAGQFKKAMPHLVLMDISLPFFNGYYWCQEIRKLSTAPIIFISSNTGSMDIVMAMSMGGDDFITKPFDLGVAVAKVQALLRRTYDFAGPKPALEHRGAVLDTGEGALMAKDQKILLTKNESRILQLLMENKGMTVTRDALMRRLWDSDEFIDDNTLTVNVARLRKKLEEAGLPGFIATKKGQGYLVEKE